MQSVVDDLRKKGGEERDIIRQQRGREEGRGREREREGS